jgi:hypothetical protein
MTAVWVIAPCSLAAADRRFIGASIMMMMEALCTSVTSVHVNATILHYVHKVVIFLLAAVRT